MATYTDNLGFNKGVATTGPISATQLYKHGTYEVTLNFATIAAARTAAGATALAANDILEIIPIPAKTFVTRIVYDVTTVEGATATCYFGDGSDDDGYTATAVNLNSVASGTQGLALTEGTPNTITGYSLGKYYSAADTIDIKLNHNSIDAAVIRVIAQVIDFS